MNTNELRALAESSMNEAQSKGWYSVVTLEKNYDIFVADAEFMAVVSPAQVIALLDEIDRLKAERDALQACAKTLYRHCVSLMESGRDIIIAEGGQCDSVAVMEMSDPWLAEARKTLKGPTA